MAAWRSSSCHFRISLQSHTTSTTPVSQHLLGLLVAFWPFRNAHSTSAKFHFLLAAAKFMGTCPTEPRVRSRPASRDVVWYKQLSVAWNHAFRRIFRFISAESLIMCICMIYVSGKFYTVIVKISFIDRVYQYRSLWIYVHLWLVQSLKCKACSCF